MTKPVFGPKRRPGRPPGIPMSEEQKELRRGPNPEHAEKIKQAWAEGRMESCRATAFKPGQEPTNKGEKYTPEKKARLNMDGLALGQPWTPETAPRYSGESHPMWKGGITKADQMERMRFRRAMQRVIFERDGWMCVICCSKGYLQVDHIKGWAKHPDLRFEESNLRTLCMDCHYEVTFGRPRPEGVVWGHNLNRVGESV